MENKILFNGDDVESRKKKRLKCCLQMGRKLVEIQMNSSECCLRSSFNCYANDDGIIIAFVSEIRVNCFMQQIGQ